MHEKMRSCIKVVIVIIVVSSKRYQGVQGSNCNNSMLDASMLVCYVVSGDERRRILAVFLNQTNFFYCKYKVNEQHKIYSLFSAPPSFHHDYLYHR